MQTMETNSRGNFTFAGRDTVELARKYGTPLMVYNEDQIRSSIRRLKQVLHKYYGKDSRIAYAGKAFMALDMCRIINEEGLYLDVVSGGELYTALKAGFPAGKVVFHGNNKTEDELKMAIKVGVGRIIVDNFMEIQLINEICSNLGKKASVMLRITPGVEAHTHEYIKTGHIDTKFGFPLEFDLAELAVQEVQESPCIDLKGLHCHIGSQIFIDEPYLLAADILFNFIKRIKDNYGVEIEEVNMGGGFGIRYTDEDSPEEPAVILKSLTYRIQQLASKLQLKKPVLYIEPGRSIVGDAGITIYRIGAIKEIPGIRKYISVDGGMSDNIRPALYGAKYSAIIANKASKEPEEVVTIAGKCCESGDMLIKDIKLPVVETGDYLVVFATGAYNYSMASNYNKINRPAVVFVRNGHDRLVIQRETYEDLIKNDILHQNIDEEGRTRQVS